MQRHAIILAAGKGTRMKSKKYKVLHEVAGKPMVEHVLNNVKQAGVDQIVTIIGHGAESVKDTLGNQSLYSFQDKQLGTAHAVKMAHEHLADKEGTTLVVCGDTPLITYQTLQSLIEHHESTQSHVTVLSASTINPYGYGRIIRNHNGILERIVEEKDANDSERAIKEISSGIFAFNNRVLFEKLEQVKNDNAQGEYYLTDLIALANQDNCQVIAVQATDVMEVEGANNRLQLAALERYFQNKQASKLLLEGVMIYDPARFDLRGTLEHGKDVEIDVNVIIEGRVKLGDRVKIGSGCVLKNVVIGNDVEIKPYSVLEDSVVGEKAAIGPFSRLRPGAELAAETHVGNFVEIKKSTVGKGSKVNHLTYVGDSEIGSNCNIGAGVITCNYDGANKFKTIIGDDVFVGSDTQLVAPVKVANGATIGAGTTITRDVGENELVITRVPQRHIQDWQRPTKKK